MKIKNQILLLLIGCWINSPVHAQELMISELPDSAISLRQHLEIFTDESNQMTWEEVSERQQLGEFIPFSRATFKGMLERGKYAYWFHFTISYQDTIAKRVVIRKFGGGKDIVYHLTNGILQDSFNTGAVEKLISRKKVNLAYLKKDFPLALQPGENKFIVRKTQSSTFRPKQIQPILLKETALLSQKDKWLYLYFGTWGVFFGILLFVLLFTIIQYFQHRTLSFLLFGLYVLSFFLVCSRQFGLENGYFSFYPPWFFDYKTHTLVHLPIYLTYVLFVMVFLETKKNFPRLNSILRSLIGLMLLYFVIERITIYFVDIHLAYRLDKLFRPLFLSISIIVLIPLLRAKDRIARLVGLGTLSLVVSTLVGILLIYTNAEQNWIWWNKAYTLSQIGILIELLFFSLALGYKTRQTEIEKNQAQLALQLKQKEALKLQELDQLKDQFFTNITHEFRTPLTVIQGIAQQIGVNPNKDLNRRTELIQSNADNLLHLVNQLLDLSKIEMGQLQPKYLQQDIIKYLGYLTESFHSLAYEKKINLSFYSHVESQLMDYDPSILKSILTNLVANALKFTPEYGKIMVVTSIWSKEKVQAEIAENEDTNTLSIQQNNSAIATNTPYLQIKIKDSGIGISEAELPYIFDRFYQVDNSDKRKADGTGIGLSLIKELVLLLEGMIKVESSAKSGSTFMLFLPINQNASLDNTAYQHETVDLQPARTTNNVKSKEIYDKNIVSPTPVEASEKPLLLIAEDNTDVIYYLKSCVAERYEILVASNGKEALDLALKHIPDVILSDVMMPEMDGYELCRFLKSDARTSHIPLVLLTAKATQDHKQKGLEMGADAYLIKPFDKRELIIRLENLVLLRKQMQLQIQLSAQQINNDSSIISKIAEKEILFLQTLKQTVEKNIQNELFKAPQLARAMAMSQTQLYRKIKALTNQATAQYIRRIRLEKAKALLTETTFSIGQVASEVGFKTQAHFTKSFQQEFGVLPSEIRK